MRVHDSQAYRKMNVTRERMNRVLELREILLSFQIGFNIVNAAVVCAILESISGLNLYRAGTQHIRMADTKVSFNVSTVVGNKVTNTASEDTAVENNLAVRISSSTRELPLNSLYTQSSEFS